MCPGLGDGLDSDRTVQASNFSEPLIAFTSSARLRSLTVALKSFPEMSTYHGPNSVSAMMLFGNSFAYLPEAETVGGNVIKCRLLLLLYHVFEGANRFLSVNIDRERAIQIVREHPAVERDKLWWSRCPDVAWT